MKNTKPSSDSLSRLERKRETDRRAQRASRAKTKAYIAFLETQASTLNGCSEDGRSDRSLSRKLRCQWEENQKLRTTLQGIASLVRDVLEQQRQQEACHDEDQKFVEESSSPGIHAAFSDPSGNDISHTSPPLTTVHFDSPVPSPESTLTCTTTGSRDYFTILSESLSLMELLGSSLPTPSACVDEDINIRAILHGWSSILAESMDIGWQTIRHIDQGLFHRSGHVERIAILRVQRAMFLSSNGRQIANPRQRPPAYMDPTPLQRALPQHARLIDYFSWPSIRNYLLLNGISCALESIAAQFATDVGFRWPYEVRDVAKKDNLTGKYSFSRDFDEAYHDLNSWEIRGEDTAMRFPRERGSVDEEVHMGMAVSDELLKMREMGLEVPGCGLPMPGGDVDGM